MALLEHFSSCHQTVREAERRCPKAKRRESLGSMPNLSWMSEISKAATGLHLVIRGFFKSTCELGFIYSNIRKSFSPASVTTTLCVKEQRTLALHLTCLALPRYSWQSPAKMSSSILVCPVCEDQGFRGLT